MVLTTVPGSLPALGASGQHRTAHSCVSEGSIDRIHSERTRPRWRGWEWKDIQGSSNRCFGTPKFMPVGCMGRCLAAGEDPKPTAGAPWAAGFLPVGVQMRSTYSQREKYQPRSHGKGSALLSPDLHTSPPTEGLSAKTKMLHFTDSQVPPRNLNTTQFAKI